MLVAAAGCTATDDAGDAVDSAEGAPSDDVIEESDGDPEPAGDGGNDADAQFRPAAEDRALMRTGTVAFEVDSFEASRERIVEIAEERGGFVSDFSQRLPAPPRRTTRPARS